MKKFKSASIPTDKLNCNHCNLKGTDRCKSQHPDAKNHPDKHYCLDIFVNYSEPEESK